MNTLDKPIGILGGTFDPVHNGHLAIANHALSSVALAQIQWIPCYQPAHQKKPIAAANERCHMVSLAIANEPRFQLNDCEIQRKGTSYMVDTLRSMRKQNPNTPLCLIVGADVYMQFNLWHEHQTILTLAHLIVVNRPNSFPLENEAIHQLTQTHKTNNVLLLHNTLAGKIYFTEMTPTPISATTIRHTLSNNSNNKPHKNALPNEVYRYILEKNLYL